MSGQITIPGSSESIILKHLKAKYGREFIRKDMTNSAFFFRGDPVLYGYPKGGDPDTDKVTATMTKGENGKREFRDNYFGIMIREDFEADVLAAISDLPQPMKAYSSYNPPYFNEIFDGTKTYADLKQWGIDRGDPKRLDVTIAVPMDGMDKTEKEEYANQVFNKLQQNEYYGLALVCFYPSEVFESITRKNFLDLSDLKYGAFSESIN